jgi:hypothetical protein
MTLRKASWFAFALLGVGLSCSSSDDSPSQPTPPQAEEAGSGGTGGTLPTELGGTGGSGARGGTGNVGNQGGDGGGDGCEPIQCALTCDIADGAPEKGEACTELGNHCEDSVFDASRCECRTTDYYCCDERWGTTPCSGTTGGAGAENGGAAGAN